MTMENLPPLGPAAPAGRHDLATQLALGTGLALILTVLTGLTISWLQFRSIQRDYLLIAAVASLINALILFPALSSVFRGREKDLGEAAERHYLQAWAVEADHLLEERVRNIVANAPFGYFAFNRRPDGGTYFSYVSPVFERMTGITAKEAAQDWHQVLRLIHPHDLEMVQAGIAQAVAETHPWQQEFRILGDDDKMYWYAGRSVPTRRRDGEWVWHGFIHDISALRRNQESQFKEAVRRRILFEQSGDGIVLLDHRGRVEECNNRFCELLGYEPDEVLRLHVWDWDADHDEAELLADLTERPDSAYETRWRRRDGTLLPMEIASNAVTLDGTRWVMCVCRDVSARKAAERALQQSEEKYGLIFADAPLGIVHFNTAGRIVDCNEAFLRILGSTRLDLIGLDILDLPNAQVVAVVKGCLQGEIRRYEDLYHSATGNRDAFVRAVFSPLRDGDGQIVGGVGVVEDITERLAARADLERQASFTQAVIDAEADGVAVCQAMGEPRSVLFTIWNPALVRITGYSQDEINALGCFETLFPSEMERDRAVSLAHRISQGERLQWQEWAIRHKDGRQRIIQVHTTLVRWQRSENQVLAVIRDVTEQRLAQRELAERQELLDAIIENLPVMLFVKTADELRYVHFNRAGEAMSGIPREKLIGRGDMEIFPEEQARRFMADDRRALLTANGLNISDEILDTPNKGRRILHTRKVPIRAADGRVQFLLGFAEDITERKVLQDALRQREQYLRAVLDNFPFLVWLKDRDSCFLAVNRPFSQACGRPSPEAMVGLTDFDVWPADLAARYRADDFSVLSSGCGKTVEEPLDIAGQRVWYETYKSPIKLDGQVIGTVGFARDITDKRNITARLARHQEELEQRVEERTAELAHAVKDAEAFSYSVSHDLRAPLRAIAGYSRILMEHERSRVSEEGRHMLDRIESNAIRMADLMDDILEYSRAGRQKLRAAQVDLTALAREVIQELAEAYPRADVILDPLPVVMGDATMLRQILINLIGNALKFSAHDAARVVIGSVVREGETLCYVRDNGVGFDMRFSGNLFNMFQRLHADPDYPGTGVGLAIVRRLLERHGGRIWAESEPNKGATFWFTLGAGK